MQAGYHATSKKSAVEHLVKISHVKPKGSDFILEFIMSGIYKLYLYDRTSTVELVSEKGELKTDKKNKTTTFKALKNKKYVYARTKFLSGFQTLADFTKPPSLNYIKNHPNLEKASGFEKVIAACLFGGEVDFHNQNIGVLEKVSDSGVKTYVMAKIDHGRSVGNIFYSENQVRDNLAYKLKSFGYKPVMDLDIIQLKEYIEQMLAVSDQEIENMVSARIHLLIQSGIDPRGMDFYYREQGGIYEEHEAKMIKVPYNYKSIKDAFTFLEGKITSSLLVQKKIMRDLAKVLEIISLMAPVKAEWLQKDWIYDIEGQDPIIYAYKNDLKIDGKHPLKYAIQNSIKINGEHILYYLDENNIKIDGKHPIVWAVESGIKIDGEDPIIAAAIFGLEIDGKHPVVWAIENSLDIDDSHPIVVSTKYAINKGLDFSENNPIIAIAMAGLKIDGKHSVIWAIDNGLNIDNEHPIIAVCEEGLKIDGKHPIVWAVESGIKIDGKHPLITATENELKINKESPILWAVGNGIKIDGKHPIIAAAENKLKIEYQVKSRRNKKKKVTAIEDPIRYAIMKKLKIDGKHPITAAAIEDLPPFDGYSSHMDYAIYRKFHTVVGELIANKIDYEVADIIGCETTTHAINIKEHSFLLSEPKETAKLLYGVMPKTISKPEGEGVTSTSSSVRHGKKTYSVELEKLVETKISPIMQGVLILIAKDMNALSGQKSGDWDSEKYQNQRIAEVLDCLMQTKIVPKELVKLKKDIAKELSAMREVKPRGKTFVAALEAEKADKSAELSK